MAHDTNTGPFTAEHEATLESLWRPGEWPPDAKIRAAAKAACDELRRASVYERLYCELVESGGNADRRPRYPEALVRVDAVCCDGDVSADPWHAFEDIKEAKLFARSTAGAKCWLVNGDWTWHPCKLSEPADDDQSPPA